MMTMTTTSATDETRHAYRKDQHDEQAGSYEQYDALPLGLLEHQLQEKALGDCVGMTVLDLGGGQGLRARQAIALGAKAVDVVDLSQEFMRLGKDMEEREGRGASVIHWFEGDASRPDELARLPLRHKEQGYDLVLANWLFDHASSMDTLDGMFRSVGAFLKPGTGRLVGTRTFYSPRALAVATNAYGARYKDHVEIPGGVLYRYDIASDPPVEFEAASMEVTFNPALVEGFHARYGLVDTLVEKAEEASCVKKDPEFWKLFLEHPSMAVVSARKTVDA